MTMHCLQQRCHLLRRRELVEAVTEVEDVGGARLSVVSMCGMPKLSSTLDILARICLG